uniref:Fibrinogen C-terminal domain-containing protein n=1 Tax=Anopheles atroparvus TaxID=41427 RepID=A0A182JLH7_ANOAO
MANEFETNGLEQPIAGNTIALMLAKLDYLQSKLLEMDLGLKERDEEFAEQLLNLETQFNWAGHNLTALQEQSRKILAQQAACASHEQMRKEISELGTRQEPSYIGQLLATSLYLQGMDEKEGAFDAFCEQNSFGGGWLVIQYRFDGSLDFFRNWTEYRNGFGDIKGEFWFGLEKIHQLTSRQQNELMVEMKDFDGAYSYAHYKHFEIGSETEHYPLKKLGAYDGNAGDALDYNRVLIDILKVVGHITITFL